ncbi:MAG TPA: SDR family oxidoreductase [Stellaceae bacterium]|nr:SDR family oxidoreductase [Stellaceae bacterium]
MTGFASYPSLRERRVLVTGGASGIGASIVEHFAAQGARVGFIDLDAEAAERLTASLGERRGHAVFARADLCDIAALRRAVDDLRTRLGGAFNVLVNNAARDDRHKIDAVTPDYWDERMATNLRHQFFAAQALKDEMIAAGGGSIINFTSISFRMATGGMPVYLTAKAAVIGLTRALARDLGPHHIRVNSVMPGWIMTPRQIELWLTPEGEENLIKSQCIPEKLYPPDIARMVLWLAADDSRLVTAQTFVVDGGRT